MALDPAARGYRFTVLGFASLMIFGSYFAYDSLGAVTTPLLALLGVDRGAIGATYTMYSLAAIPAVLMGGVLIDRLGTRRASLLFSLLVTAGAAVVAVGAGMRSLGTIYAGRLVFGMASESLIVAQSAILARWFTGKELALAFGIALAISRLGTLFTFNTMALLEQRMGLGPALWVATGLCGASLLANLVYNGLDRRAAPALGLSEGPAGDRITWKDVGRLPSSYWYVVLLCVTFYSAIFPFTGLSTDLFHDKWAIPLTDAPADAGFVMAALWNILNMFSTAGGITSIPVTASMFFAPFAGLLVDRIGRRATAMIGGSILLVVAHAMIGYSAASPILPMVILGAAFVWVPAAMWPSIPLLVDKERVGTAYGLMTAIQNVGLAAFPFFNGALRDATGGWTASQTMFAGLGAVGLVFAVLLKASDRRHGQVLERP